MDVYEAIRGRRTVKAFRPEPLPAAEIEALLELARWAPNHRLTFPWRFRVIGPQSLRRLKDAAAAQATATVADVGEAEAVARAAAAKLDRAPTLVVVSSMRHDDPVQHEEDLHATGVATYIVLLAAHARGFAGYWRTPAILRSPEGRAAVGVGPDEQVVGLLHLGHAAQDVTAPARPDASDYVTRLD